MARRSVTDKRNLLEEPEIEYVTLVLMKSVKLNYTGPVTNNLYVFNGAGSQVAVDKRDVEKMLMKKSNLPCCTGSMQTPYFSILKG
jgi:hypothetical protein